MDTNLALQGPPDGVVGITKLLIIVGLNEIADWMVVAPADG